MFLSAKYDEMQIKTTLFACKARFKGKITLHWNCEAFYFVNQAEKANLET